MPVKIQLTIGKYYPWNGKQVVSQHFSPSAYQRVETLTWTPAEATCGQLVHIKKFPKDHQVKVFRLVSDSGRTEYIATNDLSGSDAEATQQKCRLRWKIEQLHRELKQTTGIGECQGRSHRAQRNHIGSAFLVWVSLMRKAAETGQTLYQVKHGLLSEYLSEQLKSPALKISAA